MLEENKVYISLEDCVNSVADRQFLSKAQKEIMYREWSNIPTSATVLFDEKEKVVGFRPYQAIEKIDCTIMIDPKSGEIEVV